MAPLEPLTTDLQLETPPPAASAVPRAAEPRPTPVVVNVREVGAPALASPPIVPAGLRFEDAVPAPSPALAGTNDGQILLASCSSCGGGSGLLSTSSSGGMPPMIGACSTCGGPGCIPNRKPCWPCESHTVVGRFLCGVYECICCPDHCYDPHWLPIADAAFFVESARPQTQQRYRWDAGYNLIFPDRNEFFWARADGFGTGPSPKAPFKGEKRLDYNDLSLYTETAAALISLFVNLPYRSINPEVDNGASGFGDMDIGTKTLLFDCELFQIAFQLKTTLPVGNFTKGLGAGHVSLEPSLILGLRIGPDTYFQGQVAEWIPFGTSPGYFGSLLHYHGSFNQTIWRVLPDVPLIATLEANGWSFQAGSYTDPFLGSFQKSNGENYLSFGPGFRLVICDRFDFGIGTAFAVSNHHWADQLYRSEFRYRF